MYILIFIIWVVGHPTVHPLLWHALYSAFYIEVSRGLMRAKIHLADNSRQKQHKTGRRITECVVENIGYDGEQ